MKTLAYYLAVLGVAALAYSTVLVPAYRELTAQVAAVPINSGGVKAPD